MDAAAPDAVVPDDPATRAQAHQSAELMDVLALLEYLPDRRERTPLLYPAHLFRR